MSPFPPRVPMSDPNRPQPQSKALLGALAPSLPRGRGPSSTQRFKSKSGEGLLSTSPGSSGG